MPEPIASTKANRGNFFEDFRVGQEIIHPTPRTITAGDVALYTGLYGSRFAVQSSNAFAQAIGLAQEQLAGMSPTLGHAPIDDLIVFHVIFGKTVPDISLNAVANLGYAECRFVKLVYPGDTLSARSEVIGLKENSNGETGVVYVRTTGRNQHGEIVLTYVRWVMVKKSRKDAPTQPALVPKLEAKLTPAALGDALPKINVAAYETVLSGSPYLFDDYRVGECIDHVDGITIEEAEHQIATRLYQNTAKVHFDNFAARETRFGRRLIYGGIAISIARVLTFNGLGNAFRIAAINGGRHVAPLFSGDTVYAWSEVLETSEVGSRKDVGALRLRTVATKNQSCGTFPFRNAGQDPSDGVILDLDYWVLLPRRD
jgi:2-methylfumaryl-CoA hydratase